MAGIKNQVLFGDNVDFSGNIIPSPQVLLDGELLIGSSVAPNIRVATITAGTGITVTNGNGTIAIATNGSSTVNTLTGNTGGALSPTAGNFNIQGTGSITVAGSGSTLTPQLTGLTNHNVLVGAGTATITNVSPSSTSGIPLISQGASADPTFGTAVVAGGGTGATSFTAHSLLVGEGTSALTALGAATNGQIPIGSTGADPVLAGLTAGAGISVTNGAGSITIANTTSYATGSWTPAISSDATPPTVTYTAQRGTYVKIGALVFVQAYVLVNTYVAGTGQVTITGFPFAANGDNTFPSGYCTLQNVTFVADYVGVEVQSSQNYALLATTSTGMVSGHLTSGALAASSGILFSMGYIAAS